MPRRHFAHLLSRAHEWLLFDFKPFGAAISLGAAVVGFALLPLGRPALALSPLPRPPRSAGPALAARLVEHVLRGETLRRRGLVDAFRAHLDSIPNTPYNQRFIDNPARLL